LYPLDDEVGWLWA